MASGPSAAVANQLRTLFQDGTAGGLSDGQLLERFVQRHDEAAFAVLVARHGPMVLRVCRNRLGDPHDAEDAFQATFLVLARKARSIRQSEAVAGWLFGVAGRVCARFRAADRRRIRAEQKTAIATGARVETCPPESWAELHHELDRLPERYRLPLVLCYLEGLTYEQAAARLCCPVRTIQSRLARGRERLKRKLERRGLAPSVVLSAELQRATAAAALRFTIGGGIAAGEGPAAALAREVLRAMNVNPIALVFKFSLVIGAFLAGGWLARSGTATPRPSGPVLSPGNAAPQSPPGPAKPDESPFRMTGTVRDEQTGQPVPGARVQVDLGTRDLRGDFREAVTDASGRYTIPLPEGNARALFFDPPPGYWLPEPAKHWAFFAVTPQAPIHQHDYLVRRGNVWTFQLTRGPKKQPVAGGSIDTYHLPGDFSLSIHGKTDANGLATITLPDDAGKFTLSLTPRDRSEGMVLIKMEQTQGFRPLSIKTFELDTGAAGVRALKLVDEAGGIATFTGPIEPIQARDRIPISANLPELDPRAFGTLSGTVIDPDGRPIAGATVTLSFQYRQGGAISDRDDHRVVTDAEGRYTLRFVPRKSHEGDPTRLSVVAYRTGYAGEETAILQFRPGDDGNQALPPIRLEYGRSLSGRVIDPAGRPVVGAQIEIVGGWASSASTYRSGADGRFTIPDLHRSVARLVITFGPLQSTASFVVDGSPKQVTVQLRPVPVRAASTAKKQAQPPARPLRVGETAPNWVVRGWTDGRERSLSELKGRVVYLDFWGMPSEGTVMALPALERLRAKYEPRGVVFLSIHTPGGSFDEIRRLFALKKVSLVSAIDAGPEDKVNGGTTVGMYGARGFGTSYLIDRSGKVVLCSIDPANQGAIAEIIRKLGLDRVEKPTEDQMAQFMDAFIGPAIEKALARP